MGKSKDRFDYEDPQDAENYLASFVTVDGGLRVQVAEERAMDSYNETFACDIYLPPSIAKKFRDFLNANYPAVTHLPPQEQTAEDEHSVPF